MGGWIVLLIVACAVVHTSCGCPVGFIAVQRAGASSCEVTLPLPLSAYVRAATLRC
jgi:hypothetical protein